MVILLLHSVVGASLDFFCLFFFLFVSLVLFCCLFGIFCFYSYLIFSISLVCRLRSKGETFTNSLSWVLVCVLFLMHGSNDKELRKQINNNKKKTQHLHTPIKKRHLSKLTPSSAWTQTESLQTCCLWSFSLYSTAGEKLPCIWHQSALGKASLFWICFWYFKGAHHKGIAHAFYSIGEKSTFKQHQDCLCGNYVLPEPRRVFSVLISCSLAYSKSL